MNLGILRPLGERNFALLWAGMSVSLLGDGFYNVALAWQVYQLSNVPTALATAGVAATVPRVLVLVVAGVLSDRFDRRRIIFWSNSASCLAIGAIGLLSLSGRLTLWHIFAFVAVYGASSALFNPAYTALVPELVPVDLLAGANALDQFVRQATFRLAGPALGGLLIATAGSGWAFVFDALSFGFAALTVALMERPARPSAAAAPAFLRDSLDGVRYVFRTPWLWPNMVLPGLFGTMVVMGPSIVLLPYVVKNRLGGSAADLGLVLAIGGAGAVLASAAMGQRRLRGHFVWLMCASWALWALPLAIYGLAGNLWTLMAASFLLSAGLSVGQIIWFTLEHTHVPLDVLGRVSGIDWLLTMGLTPLSYAITAPIAAAIGIPATLVGAGLLGAAIHLAPLLFPGVRKIERINLAGNALSGSPTSQSDATA